MGGGWRLGRIVGVGGQARSARRRAQSAHGSNHRVLAGEVAGDEGVGEGAQELGSVGAVEDDAAAGRAARLLARALQAFI